MLSHSTAWAVVAATILLILVRPKRIQEAVWACSGALLLVILRVIAPHDAIVAIGRGTDVYLFLTGMMMLAELARREGVFDWLATIAVDHARGSQSRLFVLIYAVGILVTVFLSNDATAVVLTPAVLAALKKARAKPLPYLLICAFIANAASFVLPISNPANLVVFGSKMPPLVTWFRSFGLASVASVAATFLLLRFAIRQQLRGGIAEEVEDGHLSTAGARAAWGIVGAGGALIAASAFNIDLGLPTFLTAVVVAAVVASQDRGAPRAILRDISWSVLPLVAGLFVLVEAANQAGALSLSKSALEAAVKLPGPPGGLASAFGVALLSNIANNLPVGLLAAGALHSGVYPNTIRNAVLIGVDLGPNLSVTGSLATILWLVALRRDGEDIGFWKFLRYGALVMPPALALAVLASYIQ